MNIETKIAVSKSLIKDYKNELKEIEYSIESAERDKRHASTMKTMGIGQMGISPLRPIGTYNYVSNSNRMSTIESKISRLKGEKSRIERNIREEMQTLKALEKEYEYEKRPEAKLVIEGDKIYIDGDEKKTNIIQPLTKEIQDYISEYDLVINSENVQKYIQLKDSLESTAKTLNLPEAKHQLLYRLACLKSNNHLNFDYMIIDGKVLVDKDFVTPEIKEIESSKKLYQELIENNKKQYDMFEPTSFGKFFKFVREKQKEEWDKAVLAKENEYKKIIESYDKKIKSYNELKEEVIKPAEPVLKTFEEITNLIKDSYYVQQYISNGDKYQQNIENNTILKSKGNKNIAQTILRSIKDYLDKNNLKITPSNVYNLIFSNPQFEYLAKEIKNAIGYTPPKKEAIKPTEAQQISETGGPSFE